MLSWNEPTEGRLNEKIKTVSIRLPRPVYDRIRAASVRQRRRLGPQIVLLVEQHLAEVEMEGAARV
jgi:predicted DNA-binding protein